MRNVGLVLALVVTVALASACGSTSGPTPYTDMHVITRVSAQVGAAYGEPAPQIARTTALISDGAVPQPMNFVTLNGQFHKGTLSASHIGFSMLADGSEIWAIRAYDDSNTEIWLDHSFTP